MVKKHRLYLLKSVGFLEVIMVLPCYLLKEGEG